MNNDHILLYLFSCTCLLAKPQDTVNLSGFYSKATLKTKKLHMRVWENCSMHTNHVLSNFQNRKHNAIYFP